MFKFMYSQMLFSTMAGRLRNSRLPGFNTGFVGPMRSWFGLALHGLLCLAFLTLVVVLIVMLVRHFRRSHGRISGHGHVDSQSQPKVTDAGPQAPVANALVILSERYARGEISEEEYVKMKKNLSE